MFGSKEKGDNFYFKCKKKVMNFKYHSSLDPDLLRFR